MIKLLDPFYCKEGLEAMTRAMASGQPRPGAWTEEAQLAVAHTLGVPPDWVLLTNSCTAALSVAGRFLLGEKPTFPAITWPATWCWAKEPYLVDVDLLGWPRAPVDIAVALWGRLPPVLGPILDAAHAFGMGIETLRAGKLQAVCYSFGPTKEVPAVRGGCVVSPHIAPHWRNHIRVGTAGRYSTDRHGTNHEMAEPLAALLTQQLRYRQVWQARRRQLLSLYQEALPCPLLTPPESSGHLCVVMAPDEETREAWRARLHAAGIETGIHYHLPLWIRPIDYPGASTLTRQILTLPLHLQMSPSDVDRVVGCLKAPRRRQR